MCLSAAMRSPLRSKRAMISPVSPRANASGLTRISVLSIGGGRLAAPNSACRLDARLGRRLDRRLRRAAPAARRGRLARGRRAGRDVGLAVRAELPHRVERLRAVVARVLELAQAARAAQEVLLDLVVAVRT